MGPGPLPGLGFRGACGCLVIAHILKFLPGWRRVPGPGDYEIAAASSRLSPGIQGCAPSSMVARTCGPARSVVPNSSRLYKVGLMARLSRSSTQRRTQLRSAHSLSLMIMRSTWVPVATAPRHGRHPGHRLRDRRGLRCRRLSGGPLGGDATAVSATVAAFTQQGVTASWRAVDVGDGTVVKSWVEATADGQGHLGAECVEQ